MNWAMLGQLSATVYEQALIRYCIKPEHASGEQFGAAAAPGGEAANERHFFGPVQRLERLGDPAP